MYKQKFSIVVASIVFCIAGLSIYLTSCSDNQPVQVIAVPEEQKNDLKTTFAQDISTSLDKLNENNTVLAYINPDNDKKTIELVDNAQAQSRLNIILFAIGLKGKGNSTLSADQLVLCTSSGMHAAKVANELLDKGHCVKVCKNSKGEYCVYTVG